MKFAFNETMLLAMAAPQGEGGGSPGGPGSLIVMLLMTFGILYVLTIRPQQKRMTEHKKFQEALKKGDHVVTGGGIYGRIWAIESNVITLEIAKDTRIKVTRESVSSKGRPDEQVAETPEKSSSSTK